MTRPPIVWSVSGHDSGGGAGLSADQRAADAAEVHLCPVVAAVTAQSSVAVERVDPLPPEQLDAQLAALASDMPPRALKTGLLASVDNVRVVARWVDRLRERGPLALVVDPVLRASTGASFAGTALIEAYRRELLPRTTVLTPNRREAAVLLLSQSHDLPAQARVLQELGADAVCITGGDADDEPAARDWWQGPHASGWLSLPRRTATNAHGTGCTFATALASAMARGFVTTDAAVIAKMLTTSGLREGDGNPGHGAGPVRPHRGFIADPALLPSLSDGVPRMAKPASPPVRGVYAITDDADHLRHLVESGVRTVQLRLKRHDAEPDAPWQSRLLEQISRARCAALARGATLIVNDHWRQAATLGVDFVHLGQEDLTALGEEERVQLAHARAAGLRLGISSHSLWELARAAAWQPDYIACGPVWPTLTKLMPWRAQGLDNLAWWAAMSPAPVVAIGGILEPGQLEEAARAGASAACVVRGLQPGSPHAARAWLDAWERGTARRGARHRTNWPHPTLA